MSDKIEGWLQRFRTGIGYMADSSDNGKQLRAWLAEIEADHAAEVAQLQADAVKWRELFESSQANGRDALAHIAALESNLAWAKERVAKLADAVRVEIAACERVKDPPPSVRARLARLNALGIGRGESTPTEDA